MYILQTVHTNATEKLFFEDVEKSLYWDCASAESRKKTIDFTTETFLEFKNILKPPYYKKEIVQNKLGHWTYIQTTGYFPSVSSAEQYFQRLLDESYELRTVRKRWHQEHNIVAQHYILDQNYNVVKTLGDCTLSICHKFGSCTDNPDACNIYLNIQGGVIPIQPIA